MINVIIGILLVAIIGGAVAYIVKSKKKGAKCIGCPASDCCSAKKETKPAKSDTGCGCCH